MNDDGAARNPPWRTALVCISLAAIVFAVYWPAFHYGFVNLDDDLIVTGNSHITAGLSLRSAAWAFTHFDSYLYIPLTAISHMLDCSLFGLDGGGHHFTNILLHALNAALLFLALRRMTGAFWPCAFTAAVFAAHPLHVESVAWVSERKDVLSGLFFMLTLGAYAFYVKQPSRGRYCAALLFFALALLSKPMLVTLPFLLLVLDYWPLDRWQHGSLLRLLVEKIPFIALSVAASAVAVIAEGEAVQTVQKFPIPWRLANAAVSAVEYTIQTFHPAGLAVFYPHPGGTLPAWEVAVSALALAAMTAAAWIFRKKAPWFFTGWFWYLGMLVPVLGIVQVGVFARADRFTYLPQTGLCIMGAWGFAELCAKRHYGRALPGVVMTVMVVSLMATARGQAAYWRDSITLWSHALDCTTQNYQAHNSLGEALDEDGKIDEALFHFQKAAEINPGYAEAEGNIGTALLKLGNPDAAIPHLEKALTINPRLAQTFNSLGNAYYAKGMPAEAVAQYQKALDIDPGYLSACNNLAWALATAQDDTVRDGAKAMALADVAARATGGKNPAVLRTLAAAYAETGRFPEAKQTAEQALEMSETNPALAALLQSEIDLYRAHRPVRRAGAETPAGKLP